MPGDGRIPWLQVELPEGAVGEGPGGLIWVGPTAPDPEVYPIWIKTTGDI